MAWRKTTATVQDITGVVAQIVEYFHPQQVVLFGSYAYGTPTPDSDVDLLVVMETPLRHVEQAVEIRKAVDFPFPVDMLVRTPQHLAERVALGDVFLREVLTKGVVLYAANDTGAVEIRYPGIFASSQDAERCWQSALRARALFRERLGLESATEA